MAVWVRQLSEQRGCDARLCKRALHTRSTDPELAADARSFSRGEPEAPFTARRRAARVIVGRGDNEGKR